MMKKIFLLMGFTILGFTAMGCSGNKAEGFACISQEEAKKIMDNNPNCVIVDARSQEEFSTGHIKNAICIPHNEVAAKAPLLLKDKNQLILVYCRSGNRSKLAARALVDMKYTNIKEFGGINTWPYEIVK